jgi:hypothetical protein
VTNIRKQRSTREKDARARARTHTHTHTHKLVRTVRKRETKTQNFKLDKWRLEPGVGCWKRRDDFHHLSSKCGKWGNEREVALGRNLQEITGSDLINQLNDLPLSSILRHFASSFRISFIPPVFFMYPISSLFCLGLCQKFREDSSPYAQSLSMPLARRSRMLNKESNLLYKPQNCRLSQ